jgi:arabinofuranosyltransferase
MEYRQRHRLLPAFGLGLFLIVLAANAWLCDDAYITLRVVDNLLHGHGLTWNVSERVQSYTHPLWMFLLALFNFLAQEEYYSTLLLAMLTSALAVMALCQEAAPAPRNAWIGSFLLISSKAFMDFSTSGLENPLTHLLLTLFAIVYLKKSASLTTLFQLSLTAGLAMTNRMDSLLLFLPALLTRTWQVRSRKAVVSLGLGFTPFALWEGFALFYYGFPFPNTAYAKMFNDLGPALSFRLGLDFFRVCLRLEYITLPVIAAGLVMGLVDRSRRLWPLCGGIILYLFYIGSIGGDFMAGRFLSAPFLMAVIIIIQPEWWDQRGRLLGATLGIMIAGLMTPHPPALRGAGYGVVTPAQLRFEHNITDERAYYYPFTGLWEVGLNSNLKLDHHWAREGRALRRDGQKFWIARAIGFLGYEAGPMVTILDILALSDPLLARLPPAKGLEITPGHFPRRVPAGYCDTLVSGENRLRHPALAQYYDRLALAVKGPLLGPGRLRAIIGLNLGRYDHLLQEYLQSPLALPLEPSYQEWWWEEALAPGLAPLPGSKVLEITFNRTAYLSYLRLNLDPGETFALVYLREGENVGRQTIRLPASAYETRPTTFHKVTPQASREGFDRRRLRQLAGDGRFRCTLKMELSGE